MVLNYSSVLITLAGIAFFLFGMQLASDNLQQLMANRMRDLMTKLVHKPFLGVLLGMSLTLMIQSSGAVTSMLVGLGSAGVITLRQVMSVLLGTAIGTTFTVQLLSFNVAQFGLPIFTMAFTIYFLNRKRTVRNVCGVFMGFGLIFWGLEVIGLGTVALRELKIFMDSLSFLSAHPLYTIILTSVFTAIVHSSAVTIGFAMTLAATNMISLTDAVFWVYGANIGTTATALLASAGGNYVGRQVAWAHCLYKVISVFVFYFFTQAFAEFMSTGAVERDVANIHTVFNIVAAAVFYPFIQHGAKGIEKLIAPTKADKIFGAKYLNRSDFESITVAIAHAERELLRMGDIVATMIRDSIDLFKDEDPELMDSIKERDTQVDILNKEINLFIAQHINEAKELETRQFMKIMSYAADLETAADVIDNSLYDMAQKKHALKLEFSKEGWEELLDLYQEVTRLAPLSISCFQLQDPRLAQQILDTKRNIRKMEKQMRETHLERIVRGKKESINTSSIHLDVLSDYRRIVGLLSTHIYSILKDEKRD
ncbi:MAG: Na/Pi cotransporter family protein [Bdellovibrionales bacterium]|nr:Na/Pi cotransporter family protein [Bdellovibrionales bacterium]